MPIVNEERCRCCGRVVNVWKKKIVSTAAASLCRLVDLYEGEALHLDDFTVLAKDRNFSQLVLWNLIAPGENKDTRKRASGKWWPTTQGTSWAKGDTWVQKYVLTRNNQVISHEGPAVYIHDVLGDRFNYAELIRPVKIFRPMEQIMVC